MDVQDITVFPGKDNELIELCPTHISKFTNKDSIEFRTVAEYVAFEKRESFHKWLDRNDLFSKDDSYVYSKELQRFNASEWKVAEQKALKEAFLAYFSSPTNALIRDKLLATASSTLLFATTDRDFGCGFWASNALEHQENWGHNTLGNVLMEIRTEIKSSKGSSGLLSQKKPTNQGDYGDRSRQALQPYLGKSEIGQPIQKLMKSFPNKGITVHSPSGTIGNFTLTFKSFSTFEDDTWLDDNAIRSALFCLSRTSPFPPGIEIVDSLIIENRKLPSVPMATSLFKRWQESKITKLIMPTNINNTHWVLVVAEISWNLDFTAPDTAQLRLWDSMGTSHKRSKTATNSTADPPRALNIVHDFLSNVFSLNNVEQGFTWKDPRVYQANNQSNGDDCGIFTIFHAMAYIYKFSATSIKTTDTKWGQRMRRGFANLIIDDYAKQKANVQM